MNHLNMLLRDASADAPPDHLDPAGMVAAGRSRVRRRRALVGVAAAAAVGVVTIPFVLPDGGSDPAPAAPTVRQLTLADAVLAKPDLDYLVLDEFTAHSTDEAMEGDIVRGVLVDGRIIIQRYLPGRPSEVGVTTEGSPALIEVPRDAVNYLGASGTTIVFASQTRGLWLLDAERLGWRHVLDGTDVNPNVTAQPLTGNDGRVFITSAPQAGRAAGPIYEVDLARDKAFEIARGGDVAAYGGRVAWTSAADAPVGTVSVRDRDGVLTSFSPHTGDCIGIDVGITADRVVLMTNCTVGAGESEYTDTVTRVDVFDLEGNPVARIDGDDDMGPVRMADRYLTLSHWTGDQAGTYVYDLETGRFLRMSDQMSGLAGNETGVGSTVVWEERHDGDTGARYVVAEMR